MTVTRIDVVPESVSAHGRHRIHPGRLSPLAGHIEANGLRDPLILTPEHRVLGGERCLRAILARNDPRQPVPAAVVDTMPEAIELLAKRGRDFVKPMTPHEMILLGTQLEILGEPAAEERRRLTGAIGGLSRYGRTVAPLPPWPDRLDLIGGLFGMARATYQRLRLIWMAANDPDAPDELRKFAQHVLEHLGDPDGDSIFSGYQLVRNSRVDAGHQARMDWRKIVSALSPTTAEPAATQTASPATFEANEELAATVKQLRKPAVERRTVRSSLPAAIEKHTVALVAALGGLERAQADDRWPAYREKLAPSTRSELLNATARIERIVANLHPEDSRKEPTA